MKDTIIVNGKELDWLFIGEGFKIPSYNYSIEGTEIDGRNTDVVKRRRLNSLDFEIPLVINNEWLTNNKDYDTIVNELTKFFNFEDSVKLQIKSKDWYWNAYIEGPFEVLNTTEQFMTFDLKVRLLDTHRYALKGSMNTAISDQVSIVNTGTADTPIIIEARALKDSTNFMIAKGVNGEATDYFMVGQSEDAYKSIQDTEPYQFNDEFNEVGLRNWAYVPNDTSYGNLLDGGDAMGGKFTLSNLKDSIYPSEWGTNTKTNWHGAAIYKSVSKSLQDFRIRFKIGIRHYAGTGTGKAFSYVKDENGRVIFSVGYVNAKVNKNDGEIVVYAYNEHGEARKIYSKVTSRYLVNAKSIHVFMILERRGNSIKITTFKYNKDKDDARKKPLERDVQVIYDKGNFYQRKARIMNIYSGKYSKYTKRMFIDILGFSVQELLPRKSDVTPIVIRRGDLVYIDTKQHIVTINDDNAIHLKDFGSNYFNVPRGISELIISPEGTFDTVVKWQDRFI